MALLLHGWPDDVLGMASVAARLRADGYRTILPWLRGFGPTRFRHADTLRDGRAVALAQDAIDLLDGLGIKRCLESAQMLPLKRQLCSTESAGSGLTVIECTRAR